MSRILDSYKQIFMQTSFIHSFVNRKFIFYFVRPVGPLFHHLKLLAI